MNAIENRSIQAELKAQEVEEKGKEGEAKVEAEA